MLVEMVADLRYKNVASNNITRGIAITTTFEQMEFAQP